MDKIQSWIDINNMFPDILQQYVLYLIDKECHQMPREDLFPPNITELQLKQIYPDKQTDLLEFFKEDMNDLVRDLIELYDCEILVKNLENIPQLIHKLLSFELMLLNKRGRENRESQSGGKFTYKGRKYVIRDGERSGKYILVKNKKVYLSQI